MKQYTYKRIVWKNNNAWYKKIGPEHIYQKYRSIGVSNTALFSMEDDELVVIEYEGKTEDCYFITYARNFKSSELSTSYYGDTQKHLPLYRLKKELIRKKSSMNIDDVKVNDIKTRQKTLEDW